MSEIVIKSEEEFNSVIEKGVTLVDFFAVWCGPCKMLSPIIEEIADEYKEKIKVCKVDVDEIDSLAYKYGIRSVPTLVYFKDGKVKDASVGFQSKKSIISTIEKYIKN